ncbi:hypothetical protein [Tepidiforma sp.]|uniref:hypothetical protein n=1 Tax=Tepidiforma sp. TaxID=2682230 RepID=UPI002ADE13DB|nr:hypothetical protein [Tepidiforma sp.]
MLQEPHLQPTSTTLPPRASLVAPPGAIATLHAAIWMGGAHSLLGQPLQPTALATAWLVDCAGDMPQPYRQTAALHIPCVFADLEAHALPTRHILPTVELLAAAITDPATSPTAVYIMCTHGMNRSGLLTALLLRQLGLDADTAIARIRAARPGALSNRSFLEILHRT